VALAKAIQQHNKLKALFKMMQKLQQNTFRKLKISDISTLLMTNQATKSI
jgi:hypothetical protein